MNNDSFMADLNSGVAAFDSKNFAMAYQLLAPLAQENDPESLWRLGMMQMNGLGMVKNQPLGLENFIKASDLGHEIAHHMVGVAYMTGEGVEKNIEQAIHWFQMASEFGLVGAMYALGMLYENDSNGVLDKDKSEFWYAKANALN